MAIVNIYEAVLNHDSPPAMKIQLISQAMRLRRAEKVG
jgi:hypothetical protein